jgi:hypothetical protein
MITNAEWVRTWKDDVVMYFKEVLSLGEIREDHKLRLFGITAKIRTV